MLVVRLLLALPFLPLYVLAGAIDGVVSLVRWVVTGKTHEQREQERKAKAVAVYLEKLRAELSEAAVLAASKRQGDARMN